MLAAAKDEYREEKGDFAHCALMLPISTCGSQGSGTARMISCRIAVMKEADPGWQAYELPCGHDAMIDMPQRLAEILIAVS